MRRAVATVSLSGTLRAKLEAIAAARFDAIELFENDFIHSAAPARELAAMCADLGLAIDLYQPFRDFEGMPDELFAKNLDRAERKFDLMQALGAPLMLVCSNTSPQSLGEAERAAAQLHALAERAAKRNLRIGFEALAWGRHVNRYLPSVADRRARRPSAPRADPRQLPHPLARRRSGGDRGDPRRADLLRPDGRRADPGDGRPAMGAPLPQLPRPGPVRRRRLLRAGAALGLRRHALARDLQRRFPRDAEPTHRRRRDALAALARKRGARAGSSTAMRAARLRWAASSSPIRPRRRRSPASPSSSSASTRRARSTLAACSRSSASLAPAGTAPSR